MSFGTKNGNNDCFCKEALLAAQKAGCEVEFIRAMDLDIRHCTGCITCVKMLMSGRGNMCIHKDDFDWLAMKLFRADGILMVDPIFEKGASGLFHTIMDRFGPRMDTGNNMICRAIAEKNIAEGRPGKAPDPAITSPKVVSYIAIGGSDWGTHVQADHQIQAMTPSWKVIDNEWIPWAKTGLMDDVLMARAAEIGRNLAEGATHIETATYQGPKGMCPHCQCNDFYIVPGTNRGICTVCGLEGEIKLTDGILHIEYADDEWHKAHDLLSGKQIHGHDIAENEGRLAEMQKTVAYKERVAFYKQALPVSRPNHKTNRTGHADHHMATA